MQKAQPIPNDPADGKFTPLKVTYFAIIVFVLETVFFRIFNYIHDYFDATLIISYTVLGIGLGAFISSKIKMPESRMFGWSSVGMTLSLYGAFVKTVFYASAGITHDIGRLLLLHAGRSLHGGAL